MSEEKTEISNDIDNGDISASESEKLTDSETVNTTDDEISETGDETAEETDGTDDSVADETSDGKTNGDNTDEVDYEKPDTSDEKATKVKSKSGRKTPLFRAPIIIAACIFLCTLIIFGVWKCFFDTSIAGDWLVEVNNTEGEKMFAYTFTFDNENHFSMNSGGTALIGNYYLDDKKNNDGTETPIFSIYLTNLGSSYITADFGYSFEGNIFTGRVLKLTDYSGLFFPPDDSSSDEESVKKKQAITESVKQDDKTYYIWTLKSSESSDKIEYYDDFTKKDEILGSWIFTEENSGYAYTLTFYDNGKFEQLSKESRLVGAYKAEDSTCTLGYYNLGGEKVDAPVSFAVDGDTLTFNGLEYKKTADKNDYKSVTKKP